MLRKKLDRELTKRYNLTLRAMDVARPDVHADVPIVIEVTDANDETPVFKRSVYRFSVPESLQIGSRIGEVSE